MALRFSPNRGTASVVMNALTRGQVGPPGDAGEANPTFRVFASSNVAIATGVAAGQTIDGVSLVLNDLVALGGQTAGSENGFYVVPASGAASRVSQFSTYDSMPGLLFTVQEGTANADTIWQVTSNTGGTIDVTDITITQFVVSGIANVVEDVTPQLGSALDGQGFDLNNMGVLFLTEQAAAEADVAGKGQFWVETATPNLAKFTDDAGTDFQLATLTGTETLTNKTLVAPALGTPASGVMTNVTGLVSFLAADESSDTTCFPVFVTAATGELGPKTGSNFTFNSSTGALGATSFVGALTGNADTATALETARTIGGTSFDGTANITPANITIADESSDTTCFPLFVTAATGGLPPKSGSNLTFNSSTGELGATSLTGNINTAAQTNITSVGTLAGLTATGAVDFSGADDLEIPNSATPTVDTDGQIALDTTVADFSASVMKYFGGEEMGIVAMPIAEFGTPTGGTLVSYNATNDEFELVAQAGGGDMSASTYDPAAIAEQLIGLTATQTLTNKTLTSPTLTTPALGTPASGVLTNCTGLPVAGGGTGASTLTDGGILLGSGTGAVTATAVLADGEMVVGDGTTDPVLESGATLRTSIGVGTGDSPEFTAVNVGAATDTTITRVSAGVIAVEGTTLATIDDVEVSVINAQTDTAHTLVIGDRGQTITMTNASANEVTIPLNSSVAFDVGTVISVVMGGAGITTITGATSVTLNGISAGSGAMTTQYQGVSLLKTATDTWIASGDIGTVA